MYRCFKLALSEHDFDKSDEKFVNDCKISGEEIKNELKENFGSILEKAIDDQGVVKGEEFIDTWFPVSEYDVFLSYSHDDQELALMFAGFLYQEFGLKVFIDELFWGSADQLLRELDEKYCRNTRGNYDYKERNFTTTHVHAMLSTAIARAINNSEITIFLNTEKSFYKISEEVYKERTLSPWIYEEIFYTSIIKEKQWYEHRAKSISESTKFDRELKISYPLPDAHLIPLIYEDIERWREEFEKRQTYKGAYGGLLLPENEKIKHPLNVLYDLICGTGKVEE